MKNVYTVAQVNGYIKNMFTQDFLLQSILVKGEVSNCKYHSSGHIYFTLKDGKGAIACVMFAGNRSGLKFHMQEGQQVVVGGTIDVFERDGRYQLYAKSITLDGAGQLYERFEQLKRELAEQGLFAPEYKQPIPKYIQKLGIVTAATGAAVSSFYPDARRCDCTDWSCSARYYQYCDATQSICADYPVSCDRAGRAGACEHCQRNTGAGTLQG